MEDVQNALVQRLREKFSPSEARYIMRCLGEDLLTNGTLDDSARVLSKAVDEVLSGKPLQYVTGVAWFYKMKFAVNPDVLIPRPETEELVEWVLDRYDETPRHVLDVGTGSGCIAIALKRLRSTWSVDACDVSANALTVAQRNAEANNVNVRLFRMDVASPPDGLGRYNVIVSNPPYIALDEAPTLQDRVVKHEPALALFAPKDDPLFFYSALARLARRCLDVNGSVFVEINQNKADETFNCFTPYFRYVEMRKDLSGNFRMLYANGLNDDPSPR